jgi:hypothetical protein
VIAAEDKEILRELDLVGQKKADALDGLLAPVNIIAKE